MEFSQKKFREIDLFDFTSFLAWTLLKYRAHYVGVAPLYKWYCSEVVRIFSEIAQKPAITIIKLYFIFS